jgi:S-DNA-T family DNA segregation ATPase FtsK/SpoIIIE
MSRNGIVPVAGLSIYQPMFLGIDEYGVTAQVTMMYRNILIGGEPGGGKSGAVNNLVAHAALSADCRLWLFDGKRVELGPWRPVADVFVGPDPAAAIDALRMLQSEMDRRYDLLDQAVPARRKITTTDGVDAIVCVIDEVAYFSATAGDKKSQEEFARLLRDVVARGRAAGIIVIAATQRPSVDIIPTSLRDLFAYRFAFRCTTEISSDIILGAGWSKEGYNAATIAPEDKGIGYLRAEGGIPRRVRCAWLTDEQIRELVNIAAWTRASHADRDGWVA